MRSASRVMGLMPKHFNVQNSIPSWSSGRLWLMRLGYHKLNRPKEKGDDWVWIIDHSVQIGAEKFLIILGIRLRDLPKNRALTYNDVEPIELVPVKQSNGEVVYEQLEEASKKTGIPREIVSDNGSDLKAGINRFIERHATTCSIYDIKHKTASVLKHALENDSQWVNFVALCTKTKVQVQQTELAFLAPPNQRSKSRYMNIEILVAWSVKVLNFIDKEKEKPSKEFSQEKIKEKLHWVVEFREKINDWKSMSLLVGTVESLVRNNGISHKVSIQLESELNKLNLTENLKEIKDELLNFVKQESMKANSDEVLLGSSEIIESLFGKQKMLECDQSKNGFTGLILSAAAFVAQTTSDVVSQAMETVRVNDVTKWISKKLGETVQSTRKKMLNFAEIKGSDMGPNKCLA